MTSASESFVAFTMIMKRIVLSPLLGLRTDPLFLLLELRPECRTEVLGLEDLPNLDLALLEGSALEPFDRLGLRRHLPDPEAGDEFLRLGERPVDHRPLVSREPHARALRARLEPLAREHHAGFLQFDIELAHLGEDLLVRQDACLRVLVGLHQDHESHRSLILCVRVRRRGCSCSTYPTREGPHNRQGSYVLEMWREPSARRTNSAMGTPIRSTCTAMLSAIHSGSFDPRPAADRGTTM